LQAPAENSPDGPYGGGLHARMRSSPNLTGAGSPDPQVLLSTARSALPFPAEQPRVGGQGDVRVDVPLPSDQSVTEPLADIGAAEETSCADASQ
jgi:hypothetical protein